LRPLTDKTPKNLLQLGGIPIIEYALREARQCGIKRIVLITNPSNIGDFKKYIRHAAPRFPDMEFFIRIQEKPLGNGHAVLQALDLFKNEPIAVRFSDDILVHENPVLEQMMDFSQNLQGSVVLLDRIPRENVSRYGVVKSEPVEKEGKRLHRLFGAVEKPRT
jgi:UTP--glucose-1-phosphate uridylyltransferase